MTQRSRLVMQVFLAASLKAGPTPVQDRCETVLIAIGWFPASCGSLYCCIAWIAFGWICSFWISEASQPPPTAFTRYTEVTIS